MHHAAGEESERSGHEQRGKGHALHCTLVRGDAARAGVRMAACIHDSDVIEHGGWSVTARGQAEVVPEGPGHSLIRNVRPWSDTARDAMWVRIRFDRLDGRELSSDPTLIPATDGRLNIRPTDGH